ncbi:MAG: N-acylglucosamine 2-epimerase, partial [Bacteroidetes bacterium]
VPRAEIEAETEALLDRWFPRVVNPQGGYWTAFGYDWQLDSTAHPYLVTQARHLWTSARAAQQFRQRPELAAAANHGFRFLTDSLWSPGEGGFRSRPGAWSEADLPPAQLVYGNAFALYALAEYATLRRDSLSRAWVARQYHWLQARAYDPSHGGYHSYVFPDSVPASRRARLNHMGWGMIDWKDQNTHIHLLEAYTRAYEVWPAPELRMQLEKLLTLVRDTMVGPEGYLRLYFHPDWQPVNHRDSSRAYILDGQDYDHVSFGHDIETAFLLLEAARVLYETPDARSRAVAARLLDHSLTYGFAPDYFGLYDRGYYFPSDTVPEIIGPKKTWWAQAEALHALAYVQAYLPPDPRHAQAFLGLWRYIHTHLTDHAYGGWYNNGLDTDPDNRYRPKGHAWKGAYHNGRALMDLIRP